MLAARFLVALGPKELGSWAIDSILSTPNSGGYRGGDLFCGRFAGPRDGTNGIRLRKVYGATGSMGQMGLMRRKEFKEPDAGTVNDQAGSPSIKRSNKSLPQATFFPTLLLNS